MCKECTNETTYKEGLCESCYANYFDEGYVVGQPMVFPSGTVQVRSADGVVLVSAADIVQHMRTIMKSFETADMTQTVGYASGIDMEGYRLGAVETLQFLIGHYETRE
jgi:hypothetical protein